MADILADLQAIVRTGGDTYSSAEVLAVVKRAAAEIKRARATDGLAVEVRPGLIPIVDIDEIIIRKGDVQIERMSDSTWCMNIQAADGASWLFSFGAKNGRSHVEFIHVETAAGGST